MSDLLKFRTLAEVEEEAAAWVWRLDDEDAAAASDAEFEQWLRRDPRHRRAFEDLGGVWRSLDTLAEAKREEKVATFVAQERRLLANPAARRRHATRWVGMGMAACLVVVAGAGAWYRQGHESQTLATAVGQHRSARLADGSTVDLNTNSIVETRYTRAERSVYLHKGEALFTVARNAERPFVVVAGQTRVRAIGTAFNVRMHDDGKVEVIVTEGRVEVRQGPASPDIDSSGGRAVAAPESESKSELVRGQRFQLGERVPVETLSGTAVASTLAWREGALVFDGVPLSKAIEELNRYSDARLVISDPEIQGMRVGGRFRTGDVEGFVAAMTRAFPITTRRGADNVIYVHAREAAPTSRQ